MPPGESVLKPVQKGLGIMQQGPFNGHCMMQQSPFGRNTSLLNTARFPCPYYGTSSKKCIDLRLTEGVIGNHSLQLAAATYGS